MKALVLALAFFAAVQAKAYEQVITEGTIELPTQLVVVDDKGQDQVYTTGSLDGKFEMYDDSDLSMGETTRCDPGIGKLKNALTLKANIESNKSRGYDDKGNEFVKDLGHTGSVTIVIPKDVYVFGHCSVATHDLVSVSFQSDAKFEIK